MTVAHRKPALPLMAACAAIVAWGVAPLFVRGIDAPSAAVVFWRVLFALPLSIIVAYATGGRMSWALLRVAFPTGVCFAVSVIASFISFRETSIANATLIPALQPILVLLIAMRLFKERRSRTEIVCSLVALAGVTAVVIGSSSSGSSRYGDALALLNLLMFTAYFLLAKHARIGDVHTWSFLASVFTVTALVVTPWAVITLGGVESLHGTDWLLLLGLVLLPGIMGQGFMTWAHHYVDVSITSMLTLASPAIAILGAWILYDETLSAVQLAGAAVVLLALALVLRGQRGARAQAAEAALGGDLLDVTPSALGTLAVETPADHG